MKTQILKDAVTRLKKVSLKGNTLPILDNILNENGYLTISNLDITFKIHCGFPGVFLINFEFLGKILSKLPKNSDVEIYQADDKNTVVIIADKKSRFTCACDKPDDFPGVPTGHVSVGLIDDTDVTLILKAAKYVAFDDLRPVMNCVYVSKHIVGSDAHKLVFFEHEMKLKENALIPHAVTKLLNCSAPYTVSSDSKDHYMLHNGEDTIYYRIGGKYPAYEEVIPAKFNIAYECNVNEVKKTIDLALISANAGSNLVKFYFNGQKCTIVAQDIDFGRSFSQDITVERLKSPKKHKFLFFKKKDRIDHIEIGFKGTFLNELLSDCQGETFVIKMADPSRAAIINNDMLLMPMMIDRVN